MQKTRGTRLREARKLRRISQTELARQIRISPNQISMIENGQSGTSIRTTVAAASALNVSLDFLAGLSDDPRPARELLYELKKQYARIRDLEHGRIGLPANEDYVKIPVADIQWVAAVGTILYSPVGKSMIRFPMNWLRDRGLELERCRAIAVVGEAMEPTLADGCAILIDGHSNRPRNDRIFVVRIGNELVVRRVVRDLKAGWLLVSDNPDKKAFPTQPWPDDASIIAEVKWYGGSFE